MTKYVAICLERVFPGDVFLVRILHLCEQGDTLSLQGHGSPQGV